ncbi:hydroquinone glucosyltransferase-like [Rutidosis leptorrhynchoides]|uniref:hydroquinone glucosyltransferase-like n=1 Tax=Rutidosis leptorrhynchoides TaxID=125765 RepID=UPI003A9A4154
MAPHIAILPSPGMGHLIPLAEFAKRLVHCHNFQVTFIIPLDAPSPSKSQKSTLDSLPPAITSVFLPQADLNDVAPDARIETIISLTVARSLSSLRDALNSLIANGNSPTALVVDLFGTDAFDVAKELDISPYIFYPSTATCLSLFLHLPKLDEIVDCEYRDWPEPITIPGCIPVHGKYLLDPVQDRTNDAYKWLIHHAKRYRLAEGIIENSFMDLEPGAIKELMKVEPGKPPIYPVGPLVNMDHPGDKVDRSQSLKWLDDQPHGSVLFVSFGSGGTLSSSQFTELAFGLEMSEQRFVWVVRSPNDDVANATYFDAQSKDDTFRFLPQGFLDRTKGRGFVVDSWAPQVQILSHGSTGGFLSHCGWNSTLESVFNGVPLITWPLYAEQKMNSIILTQDVKVGIPVNSNPQTGLIERHEIAKVVKALMEGEDGKRVRYKMKDLKDSASHVLSQDGSSAKALAELAHKWKTPKRKLNQKQESILHIFISQS